jgi:DNA polymerase IV
MRKIIHIDMDAFYASVEQRDNPDLRGKPIAVGGDEKRGVTTTASYEARVFGVRSAMPGWQAKKLCPDLIFVPIRFDAYREASTKIRAIFRRYTDLIEPLSLDEAYLDVTENKINEPIATVIAQRIKDEIFAETQLTASAGISYCKFLAKVASDMNKPNGLTVIKPHEAVAFLEKLPVGKFYGVGKVTKAKMESLGIHTGADLKKWSKVDLMKTFGKSGGFYYNIVRGDDQRPVQPNQIRKSYAVERTFDTNITEMHEVYNFGEFLIDKLMVGIEKHNLHGRTLTLKTKNADFIIRTRSVTLDQAMINKDVLTSLFHKLIADNEDICQNLRLMGITLSKFDHEALSKKDGQLTLGFDENQ